MDVRPRLWQLTRAYAGSKQLHRSQLPTASAHTYIQATKTESPADFNSAPSGFDPPSPNKFCFYSYYFLPSKATFPTPSCGTVGEITILFQTLGAVILGPEKAFPVATVQFIQQHRLQYEFSHGHGQPLPLSSHISIPLGHLLRPERMGLTDTTSHGGMLL